MHVEMIQGKRNGVVNSTTKNNVLLEDTPNKPRCIVGEQWLMEKTNDGGVRRQGVEVDASGRG